MDKLVNELYTEGQLFCKQLEKVRSLSCVEGHFGAFIGSNVIQKALKKAEESKIVKEQIIDSLRSSINSLYENSAAWKHSLEKPFGYPGDYAILELIYDNIPHPNTTTARGRLIDLWGQSSILPRAVNARKNALRVFIEKFSEKYSEENKARILSIASGSAREIRDLTCSSLTNLDVTLLDQDKRALDFVTGFFQSRPKSNPPRTFVADALKPFNVIPNFQQTKPYDLIYSFGLYDYLSDDLIIKSITHALNWLTDEGVFVFSLKDSRFYPQWFYEWFLNWRFFSRTIVDGYSLANKVGLEVNNTIFVESGTIVLYICSKK